MTASATSQHHSRKPSRMPSIVRAAHLHLIRVILDPPPFRIYGTYSRRSFAVRSKNNHHAWNIGSCWFAVKSKMQSVFDKANLARLHYKVMPHLCVWRTALNKANDQMASLGGRVCLLHPETNWFVVWRIHPTISHPIMLEAVMLFVDKPLDFCVRSGGSDIKSKMKLFI